MDNHLSLTRCQLFPYSWSRRAPGVHGTFREGTPKGANTSGSFTKWVTAAKVETSFSVSEASLTPIPPKPQRAGPSVSVRGAPCVRCCLGDTQVLRWRFPVYSLGLRLRDCLACPHSPCVSSRRLMGYAGAENDDRDELQRVLQTPGRSRPACR